ncbi:hypothetical protein OUZ56_007729 [Daphnia magna]|uniref:Myb-like domain-containing protein n=1 Tax=Daphnia magna TaxID=35525 RepID=A0ABR0AAT6_9CRUS|nr:hypothetical protein OUZ56_007729 [Daphnia magna]
MRRVRLKVAPNLVSGPRSSKLAITNVVNDPNNKEPTPSVDEPVAVQDLPPPPPSSLTVEAKKVDNSLSCAAVLPPPAKPVMTTEPPIQEVTSHCIDKENVITGESDEVSSENLVNSSANEPNSSASSLSRYKSRNKIRPVISNATHRIRTFSSASESEDDVAKRQSRTPLSPVKKSPAKIDNVEATPLPTKTVTEKEKKEKKKRKEKTPLEMKKATMRQKFAKGDVDRSKLTMFDLIYYNPDDGERPPNATEKLQMRLKPYEVEALSQENQAEREESTGNVILDERLAEEEEMRQNEENPQSEINEEDKQPEESEEDKQIAEVEEGEEEEEDAMPVPQVRLGPDGEIILDERSLVIDTSETKRNKSQLANAPIIIENSSTTVNYGSWRKRPRAGRWSVKETARFYRALNMLGTNFSLMVKLFPGRDRIDLKRKFKSEEKTNPSLVDKIIATQIPFDISQFMDEEVDEDSSGNESTSKEPSKKKTAGKASNTRKSSKTTSKEPKMKRKEKAVKKVHIQEPVNDDECDSDEALGEPLESPTEKIPSENSEEEVEPPTKKGRKLRVAESESSVGARKPARSRIGKRKGTEPASQCDSEGDCPTSENAIAIQPTGPKKNAHITSPSNNPLDNLLNSPLGQIGLEQGGLTVVENPRASKQTPSFLVPPALAEANPAFAQAEPGSLVLVSEPNTGDPNNQLVHVYRISVPVEPVPL